MVAGTILGPVALIRRYRVPGMAHLRAHVADLGLACCAVEFVAAVSRGLLVPESTEGASAAVEPVTDQQTVDVLIVSGTLTHALEPALLRVWEGLSQPRAALAFGACTISGGPYWDSYAVAPGIDHAIPVTRYVPGCPPRPEALIEALAALAESIVPAGKAG